MRVLPTQFMIIVNNLEVETAKFLGKSKLNTIMSSTVGFPCMMLTIEPMITEIVLSLTASTAGLAESRQVAKPRLATRRLG